MPKALWLLLFTIDSILAVFVGILILTDESLRPGVINSFLLLLCATTFYLFLNRRWLTGRW